MVKISILLATFNSKDRIEKTINSVINQSFKEWELLICDDASQDSTFDMLKVRYSSIPNIILFKNFTNKGLSFSLNRLIKNSTGKYIARIDDDDLMEIDRLKVQFEFLEKNSLFSFCGSNIYLFDEKGVWGSKVSKEFPSKIDVFRGNSFVHPSVMILKSTLQLVGGYRDRSIVGRSEDYDLWCRIYFKGFKGANIQLPLIKYYESYNSFKKRKIIFRFFEFKLKLQWFIKLRISLRYFFWILKPLILTLIPSKVIHDFHRKSFRNKVKL